jgi:hypothetical protein
VSSTGAVRLALSALDPWERRRWCCARRALVVSTEAQRAEELAERIRDAFPRPLRRC